MKKCFPFLTTCGSQLEVIDKRHSNLSYVPDEVIRNARSIEECFLDANQIKDLPKNFFKLSKIRVLTLSDNELTYIPESIGNFNHLVELDVSRNHIDNVHYNIKFCNELRSLDLSNNPINRLPEGFSSLRNLTVLNLNDNSLTELPNDIGNLTLLQKLELRDNCLKTLPNSFSKFVHLELLDLGGNEFQEFPKSLAKLSEIRVLCLDNNELQNLPQEIGTLKNLQQLDVSENFLEVICDEIGNLEQLTDFVLSQNSLDSLPNNIGNLKELTVLKIDQNKLMSLTSHIGNCSKLQELYLTENLLTKLPGSLGKLSKLAHLNADRNNLNAIPLELSKCNELSIMSFRDNHIRRLPDEIGNMKKLHVLDVSINQLDRLPLSIAQCPLKALWLSENQSQSMVKLQRDKDENTSEEYLTCYLLPQSGIEGINPQGIVDSHNYASEYVSGDRNSQVLSSSGADNDSINFPAISTASDSKVRFNEDEQAQSNRISKELPKTRHPKFDKKAVDGHIIPKDIHMNKENKFAPNRFVSESEQMDAKQNGKVLPKRTKKISETSSKSSESSDVVDAQLSSFSANETEKYEFTYPHSLKRQAPPSMAPNISIQLVDNAATPVEESRLRSHSDAGLRPGEITAISEEDGNEKPNAHSSRSASQSSSSSYSDHLSKKTNETIHAVKEVDEADATLPEIKIRKTKVAVKLNENIKEIPVNEGNQYLEVSSRISREQAGYSSGGEEIDGIARHVGFSEEVEDNEEASDLKLIRRDTPHYTKKSKIQQITSDGVKNEDVVKQIMEKLRSPSLSSGHSFQLANPRTEKLRESANDDPSVQMRHIESPLTTPTYDQVVSASALARGSDVPPGLNSATSDSEEVHVIIQRHENEPLGMSIAGGKGSCPYQPVFVSRVTDNGAANRCGLRVNDKIISVNNQSMNDVDHAVAVSALKTAGNYIDLLVLREVVIAPPSLSSENYLSNANQSSENVDVQFESIKCEVVRDENGLGFSIAGGKGSMRKDLCDQRWAFLESIYICKITPNGAADKSKRLQVGDKIIKINGIDISDARHDQAVVLLSGSEPVINLEVQRQIIIPRNVDHLVEAQKLTSETSSFGMNSKDRETVKIVKTGAQLGLSICGGIDHYSHPFGINDPGVFISKISPNGAAKACGKLMIGDRIVSINGHDITKATHDDAILHILQANNEILLEVIHEPPPPGLKEIVISKGINEKLGLNIHGGNDGLLMNPDDLKDRGIFITKIIPDSAVHRDGRLKVGDRLIEVNRRSFMGLSISAANKVLRSVTTQFDVLTCDGVSPEKIDQVLSSSNLVPNSLSTSEYRSSYSPSPGASHISRSPTDSMQHSPQLQDDNAHTAENNNYISNNQKIQNLINDREHLSFRSKKLFFEKEIEQRKNSRSLSFLADDSTYGIVYKYSEIVKIIKTGSQLGLNLCGGINCQSHPFGKDDPGVFISKLSPYGAAKACGKLMIGDRIVAINGKDVTKATHDDAVLHLLQANNEIILDVIHEPPPPGLKEIVISKGINEKLGLNIHGGNDGLLMNPDDLKDRGIFITKIIPDSAVHRDGRLKVGDRLIEVNRRSFMGLSISAANKVLEAVTTQFEVLTCDGVSPENIDRALYYRSWSIDN